MTCVKCAPYTQSSTTIHGSTIFHIVIGHGASHKDAVSFAQSLDFRTNPTFTTVRIWSVHVVNAE
jgi:hypothetical protein